MKKLSKVLLVFVFLVMITACGGKNKATSSKVDNKKIEKVKEVKKEKVDVVNIDSKKRPLAIAVNNTPVAIKVQTGLNKAHIIYEIATEGSTSRLLAIYKDADNLKVGTIRSARHNFIDYALENSAILVIYGWSHYAEDQLKGGAVNYVQGLTGEGKMWRENPEKLATEHTAYLNIEKVINYAKDKKKYKTEIDDAKKTILLNYNTKDVDLSKRKDAQKANDVIVNYGSVKNDFKYNEDTKMYTRIVNGKTTKDYITKEEFTTKNIIVERVNYSVMPDNYYWDLKTIGTGSGYYITNGYAVPIKWSKESRSAKTKYMYTDGEEIEVSDGRTYIEVQVTSQKTTIK